MTSLALAAFALVIVAGALTGALAAALIFSGLAARLAMWGRR